MNGAPPVINEPPSTAAGSNDKSGSRRWLAILLSLCVGLFLVDAMVSFVDDSLILFFGVHVLSVLRGLVSILAVITAVGVYVLCALTPMVPKRLLLPIPLFYLVAALAVLPMAIHWYDRIQAIALCVSACQVTVAMGILMRSRGGAKSLWPWVSVDALGGRGFSWRNLAGFVVVNVFLVVPCVLVYGFLCAANAVGHFSEGFMALHPAGFTVQVRKYVRDDGKTIQLFPMAHVANASFYDEVAQTFPTNSIVLMEGVSDDQNLLTNKISYKRMATSLGLAEQREVFAPRQAEVVRADIDVGEFSRETLDFLNVVMLIHSQGMTPENLSRLLQYSPAPGFEKQLFDDILRKRNEHLFQEIRSHLESSNELMVPWGVAHMPGIAREIEKSGFHLTETREYRLIRFWGGKKEGKVADPKEKGTN